ncbi:chromosome segregation protein SMC [Neobacillus sp. MM2021_6]|uniref:chromosome segregation protein SMC n=1 Tax=Bacillaceae TaxID=186817 RepID=UPI00140887C5|nr:MULTISPECIES: chromosome segregation protein SMC [Bacillaceae]MBO0959665.1 chromosome segregation protein SMC [Neobacillus sp. MM2021_6]NHC19774.1 chromosome segregation protein SMC [Bacillus sp. MM2020_4]
MIPWRMTFSGIRDYRPEQIDLSGIDHHIMITGPNGSGKSTITYCMGAVLYSSKVDVEGLKSRNLLPDQTWKAQISIVFKNNGKMKIDAATFIQFTLRMVQEPGQPIKKEYSISTGEEMDQWEQTIKYSSGDRQFNFSAYKKDLLYKYKIDPDAYYLIWYQQEVNQFAVMNPEERFRIFSEMHGIDQTQREWEESIEKLKETTETLKTAKFSVDNKRLELQIKKADLDRFTSNQERLQRGAREYTESLLLLETALKKELNSLEGIMVELSADMEEAKEAISLKQEEKEKLIEQMNKLLIEKEELEGKLEKAEDLLKTVNDEIQAKKQSIALLEKELEDLTKRKNQITRTEKEVQEELDRLVKAIGDTSNQLDEVKGEHKQLDQSRSHLLMEIAKLDHQVEEDERLFGEHSKRLAEYKSSHDVSMTISKLDEDINAFKNEKLKVSNELHELKIEQASLLENRDLSKRQSDSLAFLRMRNIKAYPLRELVELDEQAQLKDEGLFNAIKYTIFFHGKHIDPPNDLYHVPLMETVPDRSVDALPELHLKITDGMKEEDIPHALKALWWVGQFFKNGPFKIVNGSLHDPMGIRGPQEKERYLLSKKALLARRKEVEGLIAKNESRLLQLNELIGSHTKKSQELNRIIQYVREAEAFMATDYERQSRNKRLEEENKRLVDIQTLLGKLDGKRTSLHVHLLQLQDKQGILEEEEAFYEELGKMKGKYDHLLKLQSQFTALKDQYDEQVTILEGLEDELNKLESKMKKRKRIEEQLVEEIESSNTVLKRVSNQLGAKQEEKDVTAQQLVEYIKEITEIKELVPQVYSYIASESIPDVIPSVTNLKNQRENGKIMFDAARREPGIDPAAPENYEAVKFEFERLDNEYKRTNILLDQDRQRAEELKDKLETTINMRVTEIRRRFQSYMSHFQFEGEVDWDSSEDKRGRTHFKLFIKARKEGHRGTMEDVSTKARGGRVGKGVSGGEESLSSLLFALALLQNLSFKPGFIVLDEFDSALDENRKLKVFDLYVQELNRKLIILTPKSHEEHYLKRFGKALVVQHDPTIPSSKIVGIVKKDS